MPTFVYQARYTGTPWAKPPNFAAIINAVTGFTDNQATLTTAGSNQGRLLALGYFALVALALFGVARDHWHVDLDLRGRRRTRGLTFVVVCTLAAAITGGIVTGSAFSPRYAAVVFVPLLVLVAYGAFSLAHAGVRSVVVAVLVVAGLAGSVQNVYTQRTQAPQVASVLAAQAKPGDIVAFCPDQLGPAVYRLAESGQSRPHRVARAATRMLTFPRGTGPAFVDWVDYKTVAESTGTRRPSSTGSSSWPATTTPSGSSMRWATRGSATSAHRSPASWPPCPATGPATGWPPTPTSTTSRWT